MTDSVGHMGDREIVTLLAAGDPQGLELAYTAYADRIHDYARRTLRNDPSAAADVTQDTFLIALAKAGDLRDPDKFRPWLYAIARNECLRVLRASSRTTNLDPEIDLPAEGEPEMSTGMTDHDLRDLVHAAAAGLSPKDREVFDLGMRHDLSAAEIAAALGVSDNAAHAMLSRVRTQFEKTLGAYVVARSGREECPELASMLSGWDGDFDALWRKRIARHVSGCGRCAEVERRELAPSALLGVMPLFAAPLVLRDQLFGADLNLVSFSPDLMERAHALADRAGPFERDGGFPGRATSARRGGLLALVVAAVLLLGGVGVLRLLVLDDTSEPAAGAPSPTALDAVDETLSVADPNTIFIEPEIGETPSLDLAPETSELVAPTTLPPVTSAPPTSSAPTNNPTTKNPQPAEGTLEVTPLTMTVGPLQEATIRVTARGGPVDWSATFPTEATLSPSAGSLDRGESVVLTFRAPRTQGTYQIVFQPGGVTITVQVVAPG